MKDKLMQAIQCEQGRNVYTGLDMLAKQVCSPTVDSVEDTVQKELSSLSSLDKASPCRPHKAS